MEQYSSLREANPRVTVWFRPGVQSEVEVLPGRYREVGLLLPANFGGQDCKVDIFLQEPPRNDEFRGMPISAFRFLLDQLTATQGQQLGIWLQALNAFAKEIPTNCVGRHMPGWETFQPHELVSNLELGWNGKLRRQSLQLWVGEESPVLLPYKGDEEEVLKVIRTAFYEQYGLTLPEGDDPTCRCQLG